MLTGDEGILDKSKEAVKKYKLAEEQEKANLDIINQQVKKSEGKIYNENKKVNEPELLYGMKPIKFVEPENDKIGSVVTTSASDDNWYNYEEKKWANAQTEDGSMWVWIPRFAYKINGENNIDVKFLIGTTDEYYDETEKKTAQRQTAGNQTIDTIVDYTVHPAFTNESSIGYANGGWDEELTGIWVAKFEAGYASGNNNAPVVASKEKYSQTSVWGYKTENDGASDGTITARNWLDGIYSVKNQNNTYSYIDGEVTIKYPTFQGMTYAMNYINHNDAYKIAKALTDRGNIYGLNSGNADSHLMKNSEWGAVAYLTASQYGKTGEIKTNNINLNSGAGTASGAVAETKENGNKYASVYGVTGCSSNTTNTANHILTVDNFESLNSKKTSEAVDGAYKWNQVLGQNASSTGTIYGIYDLNGGLWEIEAGLVANGRSQIRNYGKAIADEAGITSNTANIGQSTKYVTIYSHDSTTDYPGMTGIDDTKRNTASQANYNENTKYGDAIKETNVNNKAGTSNSGWNASSWNGDYSSFASLASPFFLRGGDFWGGSVAGSFAFNRINGNSYYNFGFRAVLVSR